MNRKTKIVVSVAGILIVSLFLIGLTYAYFLTRINGNTNPKSISASTQKLELTYSDNSNEIIGDGKELVPSNEPIGSKTFTVTNNGGDTNYSVVLEDMSIKDATTNEETTFESNDFRYTLTCIDKSGNSCDSTITEQTELPLISVALLNNNIVKGDVHTYTLTMWYLETGADQSNDMGKSISAKINIIDPIRENPYKNNKNSLAYNIINNAMIWKNGTEFRAIPKTIPAQEITTDEYIKQQDPTSFTSTMTNATIYYISYADDYTVDKKTGKFTLIDPTTVKYSTNVSASGLAGKYAYWNTSESSAKNTTNLSTIYKITTNTSDITSSTIKYTIIEPTVAYDQINLERELSMAADDYGTSYYYRGSVTDNYLELNNMCFRIVRIEGDGSIKLTLSKEGLCSSITEADTESAYLKDSSLNNIAAVYGYVRSGSKYRFNYEGYTREDGLYRVLNDWFDSKFKENGELTNIGKKLKNETWCLGGKTSKYDWETGELLNNPQASLYYWYETGKRLYGIGQEREATYKCSSEADKVTGYVGALTADEVVYAGGKAEVSNYIYYLRDNAKSMYWLLSRGEFYNNSYDEAFYVSSYSSLNDTFVTGKSAVRPVISLATGAEIASGDGTQTNPYKIK